MNIDCFNLVQLTDVNCKSFNDVLRKVAKDFDLYGTSINYEVQQNWEEVIKSAKKIFSSIRVKRKDFSKQELEWWRNEGVSLQTLQKYNVASIQYLWLNDRLIYESRPSDPGYVQHFGIAEYYYKAYFPLRKKYRFLQNISDKLQGFSQLPESGDMLVITNSNKAVMAMSEFNVPAIAPMSESVIITEQQFQALHHRFPIIFTLFDRDRTGMWASQQMRKRFNTIPLLFDAKRLFVRKGEEPKDWNEQYKKFGTSYMLELIEYIKEEYQSALR
jgi:hypothetical protein